MSPSRFSPTAALGIIVVIPEKKKKRKKKEKRLPVFSVGSLLPSTVPRRVNHPRAAWVAAAPRSRGDRRPGQEPALHKCRRLCFNCDVCSLALYKCLSTRAPSPPGFRDLFHLSPPLSRKPPPSAAGYFNGCSLSTSYAVATDKRGNREGRKEGRKEGREGLEGRFKQPRGLIFLSFAEISRPFDQPLSRHPPLHAEN